MNGGYHRLTSAEEERRKRGSFGESDQEQTVELNKSKVARNDQVLRGV